MSGDPPKAIQQTNLQPRMNADEHGSVPDPKAQHPGPNSCPHSRGRATRRLVSEANTRIRFPCRAQEVNSVAFPDVGQFWTEFFNHRRKTSPLASGKCFGSSVVSPHLLCLLCVSWFEKLVPIRAISVKDLVSSLCLCFLVVQKSVSIRVHSAVAEAMADRPWLKFLAGIHIAKRQPAC
jgi:hypothetical protein